MQETDEIMAMRQEKCNPFCTPAFKEQAVWTHKNAKKTRRSRCKKINLACAM